MTDIESRDRRLLLISNSTLYGSGYLDHAEKEVRDFLGAVGRVLFVPFAQHDRDAYAASARRRLEAMGYELDSVHEASDPRRAVEPAEAVFIGGGNTFRLLKGLYDFDLLAPIRRKVAEGMPYIGSSAGSIVACPTLKTTKDMPVVQPLSFDALLSSDSKSARTIWTPIPVLLIWVKPRRSGSINFSKRTMLQW